MTAIATLAMVQLDCEDPRVLAGFYHGVLGWEVTHSEEEYAMISDGSANIGFARVPGYEPPSWPQDDTKRYHLDLYVDDLDTAESACRELGATRADFQPGAGRWRVLLDPAGQPFCVCVRS